MSRTNIILCAVVLALGIALAVQHSVPPVSNRNSEADIPRSNAPLSASANANQNDNHVSPGAIQSSRVDLSKVTNKQQSDTKIFDPATAVLEAAPTTPVPGEIFRTASRSVVLIKTYDANNTPLLIGSGFFVGDGAALVTNAHVIAGASRIEYLDSSDQVHPVSGCLAIDIDGDLALLAASGPALQLATQKPEVGDHVFVIGNPKGLTQSFSDGLVSSIRKIGVDQILQITAPISPGSSGGPVLNAMGQVIGVASFYYQGGENLNFAITSSKIISLLKGGILRPISEMLAAIASTPGAGPTLSQNRVEMTDTGQSSPQSGIAVLLAWKIMKILPSAPFRFGFFTIGTPLQNSRLRLRSCKGLLGNFQMTHAQTGLRKAKRSCANNRYI